MLTCSSGEGACLQSTAGSTCIWWTFCNVSTTATCMVTAPAGAHQQGWFGQAHQQPSALHTLLPLTLCQQVACCMHVHCQYSLQDSCQLFILCCCTDTTTTATAAAAAATWAACSLRALYGTNGTRNATHGSDSPASAAREIKFYFPDLKLDAAEPAGADAQVRKSSRQRCRS